ncbi:hypothetical protein D3C72_1970590 [compost metagenome]
MHLQLQLAFGFHDQPGAAKQGVGNDQAQAAEQAKRCQPVQGATGIAAVDYLEAFDKGAQRHTLEEGGSQ